MHFSHTPLLRFGPTPVQNPVRAIARSAGGTAALTDSTHATTTAPIDAHRMARACDVLASSQITSSSRKLRGAAAALVPLLCTRGPAEHDTKRRNARKAAEPNAIVTTPLHRDRACYLALSSHPLSCCAASYCESASSLTGVFESLDCETEWMNVYRASHL